MLDLYELLGEQRYFFPIKKDRHFYNPRTQQFYTRMRGKIVSVNGITKYTTVDDTNIQLILESGKPTKLSRYRLICFFQNGLHEGMATISERKFCVRQITGGKFRWVATSEDKMQYNRDRLQQVFDTHPDLLERDGFFDEGVIPFKLRPGFFIVPTTNGTMAINPQTQEAVFTYSNEVLYPQFHSRGDRKYTLNKRLGNQKGLMIASRAIAYVTKSVPEKYMVKGQGLKEVISKLEVDHIDTDPRNNHPNNLQYLTSQENLCKKLDQEMDPRVLPTTWKDPQGNIHRFRSVRRAAEVIGCNLVAVGKVCKGWKRIRELNGWILISGGLTHPLEEYYAFFEQHGVDRESLRSPNSRGGVITLDFNKKTHLAFLTWKEALEHYGFSRAMVDSKLGIKGPISLIRGVLIFPRPHFDLLIKSGVIDKLNGMS